VDFFDADALVSTITEALAHPDRFRQIRANARRTVVEDYDLTRVTLPRQLALMSRMMS